jgi:DNA-binding NarL/FixJ family response regulator
MVMPENITGLDLALRLRKKKGSLKVIISSGYSADLRSPSAVGPDIIFLPKPYRVAVLAKAVRCCLDRT